MNMKHSTSLQKHNVELSASVLRTVNFRSLVLISTLTSLVSAIAPSPGLPCILFSSLSGNWEVSPAKGDTGWYVQFGVMALLQFNLQVIILKHALFAATLLSNAGRKPPGRPWRDYDSRLAWERLWKAGGSSPGDGNLGLPA